MVVQKKNLSTYARLRLLRTKPSVQAIRVIVEENPMCYTIVEDVQYNSFQSDVKGGKPARKKKADVRKVLNAGDSDAISEVDDDVDSDASFSSGGDEAAEKVAVTPEIESRAQKWNQKFADDEDFSLFLVNQDNVRMRQVGNTAEVHPEQPPEPKIPFEPAKEFKKKRRLKAVNKEPLTVNERFRQSLLVRTQRRQPQESTAQKSYVVFGGKTNFRVLATEQNASLVFANLGRIQSMIASNQSEAKGVTNVAGGDETTKNRLTVHVASKEKEQKSLHASIDLQSRLSIVGGNAFSASGTSGSLFSETPVTKSRRDQRSSIASISDVSISQFRRSGQFVASTPIATENRKTRPSNLPSMGAPIFDSPEHVDQNIDSKCRRTADFAGVIVTDEGPMNEAEKVDTEDAKPRKSSLARRAEGKLSDELSDEQNVDERRQKTLSGKRTKRRKTQPREVFTEIIEDGVADHNDLDVNHLDALQKEDASLKSAGAHVDSESGTKKNPDDEPELEVEPEVASEAEESFADDDRRRVENHGQLNDATTMVNASMASLMQDVPIFLPQNELNLTIGVGNDTAMFSVREFLPAGMPAAGKKRDLSMMSVASETGLRPPTAMTVIVDQTRCNVSSFHCGSVAPVLPFYLEGMSPEEADEPIARLLHVIGQQSIDPWTSLPKDMLQKPVKLGEGSYGEVFQTTFNGAPVAIKIVPFEEDGANRVFEGTVNGEVILEADLILPEVVITRELSRLNNMEAQHSTPNFVELIAVKAVKGKYPTALLKAWDAYKKNKGSDNEKPTYATTEQRFLLSAFAVAGVDLEKYQTRNEAQLMSVLVQLSLALMVAEEQLEFEHRDLHLGNVLIQQHTQDLEYRVNGFFLKVKSTGVKANIIDFTLSRMKSGVTTLFRDLENDDELFAGTGDYQFDIYRMMKERNGNRWKAFEPKTNCFWLHFLATKMLEKPIRPARMSKKRIDELQTLFDKFLSFEMLRDSFHDEDFYSEFYKEHVVTHEC